MYLGNFSLGQTVRFEFSGRAADGSDSAITGSPTTTVWRDGNVVQRTSSAGMSATLEFDSDTGHAQVAVDTADDTDAGFWRRASVYTIKVSALTVDGIAVSVRHTFGIEHEHEDGRISTAATSQGVGTAQVTLASGAVTAFGTLIGAIIKELSNGQERVIISEASGTDICGVNADWNPALTGTPRYHLYAGSPDYLDPIPAIVEDFGTGTALEVKIDGIKAKTDNLPADPAAGSAVTAVSGLVTTVDTVVDGIKAKTDNLTFTVGGLVDGNQQAINDTILTGDGGATPWGPV